jgi:hypothetical protein
VHNIYIESIHILSSPVGLLHEALELVLLALELGGGCREVVVDGHGVERRDTHL